jgi:hypothetical protein
MYESPAPLSGRISYWYHYARIKPLPTSEHVAMKTKLVGAYENKKDANGKYITNMFRSARSMTDLTSGWSYWADEPVCQIGITFSLSSDGTFRDFASTTTPCSPYTAGQQMSQGTWTLSPDGKTLIVVVGGVTTYRYLIEVSNTGMTTAFNIGTSDIKIISVKK